MENNWKYIKLGKAATFVNGYAFKPTDWNSHGLEIIRIQNLTKSSSEVNYFDGEIDKKYKVTRGDLLISWSATLGIYEWNDNDAWLNQHIFKVIFNKKQFNKNYFRYVIIASLSKLEKEVHGATMKHITKKKFDEFIIPYPDINTQKHIADILDAADALRRKTQQIVDSYDELAQSLFLEVFGDPVSNPRGWKKVKMGSLMTILRGGSPRPIENYLGGEYPWIKIGDATKGDNIFLHETKEHIIKEGLTKTRLLKKGSLIFANCGVSLGFARIITFEGCIHDGWLAFSDIDENLLNKIFILKALNSITDYFRKTAPDGTQPNLNTGLMKNFDLIVPPIDIQNSFVEKLTLIEQQKELAKQSLAESKNLFNALLQKAFKGELVPEPQPAEQAV